MSASAAQGASGSSCVWSLRLRGPKGTPAVLDLPEGALTTVARLLGLAGKATRVAENRLSLRAGFPPKELSCEGSSDSRTLVQLGLANRDVLHIDRRPATGKAAEPSGGGTLQAEDATTPSSPSPLQTPKSQGIPRRSEAGQSFATETASGDMPLRMSGAAAGTPVPRTPEGTSNLHSRAPSSKRRRIRMPGSGRRLGDGAESDKEDSGAETPAFAASMGSCLTGIEAGEHALAADLVAAVQGGTGTVTSVHKALRRSLREARKERGAEAEAMLKVAAALSGQVAFRPLKDHTGRVEVEYVTGSRGAAARELVTDIPPILLPAILNLVASDTDPVSRGNLKVEAMALVSPRMFWAIVRHGNVGPQRSFHEAMTTLVPQVDWAAIERRDRRMPERYADYVSH